MSAHLTQRRVARAGEADGEPHMNGLKAASPQRPQPPQGFTDNSLFSANPSKRRGERFFLLWSPFWIAEMAVIVLTRAFESFTGWHYMLVGLNICLLPIIIPLLFPGEDRHIPVMQRYTTKANIWIFILAWMANYFWTHYFYHVLGCSYTMEAHRLNDVPFAFFLISHSYFHLYHSLSNILLRLTWRKFNHRWSVGAVLAVTSAIVALSYFLAFAETFTIQNFPYYHIPDRWAMYVYGSMFYALYFIVSFPMFYRVDEQVGECWSAGRAAIEAFAASMMITQALDFWRIIIGPIVDLAAARESARAATPLKYKHVQPPSRKNGVPFVY